MSKAKAYHVHIECFRHDASIYRVTEAQWAAAAERHKALAPRVSATIGWDRDDIDAALMAADMLISPDPPRERLRERAPRLRWIQTRGAGVNELMPLDWLPSEIALTNNRGAHGAKCEDFCTMALLMLNSRMPGVNANQRVARWEQIFTPLIAGKTAVIIGFGDLGSAAGRAAKRLGLKVAAFTRSGRAGKPADVAYQVHHLDGVLPDADFVVVAAPLTPETRGVMNRARLALLKPEAGLINVGRAPLVDYEALCDMLSDGRLAGAVLDVFDSEPLRADSPLWSTTNLVVTPHVSCDDPRYMDLLLDRWFGNFERFLAGKPLRNRVDRKLGY
jgi:phosphoglycerate dehydrogenase-like enzyme